MVARYFFELLILYLFLNIIHIEKNKITEFYLPVRGLSKSHIIEDCSSKVTCKGCDRKNFCENLINSIVYSSLFLFFLTNKWKCIL